MDQILQLTKGIRNQWATSPINASIPSTSNQLIFNTVYSGTTYPYCEIEIELGDNTEYTLSQNYIQEYHVVFKCYGYNDGNVKARQTQIYQMFPSAYKFTTLDSGVFTLHILPRPGKVYDHPQRGVNGTPVFVTESNFIIVLQEKFNFI